MPIQLLQDIIDQLADQVGVYGAHDEENDEACQTKPCRVCWTSELNDRIWAAVRTEQQLERGAAIQVSPTESHGVPNPTGLFRETLRRIKDFEGVRP